MASGRIKGITIEIGGDATKLDKALSGVERNLFTIQKDLQAVEKRLKLDPTNTELLAQKQRLLAAAVAESKSKVDTLSRAAENMNRAFAEGKIDKKQLENFNLELELSESDLKAAERALSDFNDELKKTDGPAGDAADGIKKVGDASGGSGKKVGALGSFASGAADGLNLANIASAGAAFTIGQKLTEAAIEAVKWMWNLDEATEEYREAIGKLNSAAEAAGFGAERANEAYKEFFKILGDTDTATEATQLLLNMENRESEMSQLTDILSKNFVRLGNDIPIDELLQSINIAAQTGEVTGALAEALEMSGTSAEFLEQSLANAAETARAATEESSATEKSFLGLDIVTKTLAESLLSGSADAMVAADLFSKLADTENDLAKWTDVAAGVYATFGDALPIEGLIEAANETAKTGKVTGVLADALNWAGISEDEFNEALEKNSDAGDRANLIMNTLARTYGEASDAFYENNEALIASREAQSQLDESMAKVGEAVSNVKTALLETFGPMLADMLDVGARAFNALVQPIKAIGDLLSWLGDRIRDVANFFRDLFGVSGQLDENWNVVQTGSGNSTRAMPEAYSVASPYALASFSPQDLPHLAQGTVARPNSPFLAVIGDNTQEPEIVAPYSTIKRGVREAMSEAGGSAVPVHVTVTFAGTMAQLVRQMQPQISVETNRRGPEFVT